MAPKQAQPAQKKATTLASTSVSAEGTYATPPTGATSTSTSLRTVTRTVLEAPMLDSFTEESYRQWALVDIPLYFRIAKDSALPLSECIDSHTKFTVVTILQMTETEFDALDVEAQWNKLDSVYSPYLAPDMTLHALASISMQLSGDIIASYNDYTREFNWRMRLANAHKAAVPPEKQQAKQFVSGLMGLLKVRMSADSAVTLATIQTASLQAALSLREASRTLGLSLFAQHETQSLPPPSDVVETPYSAPSGAPTFCNRCGSLEHITKSCSISYEKAVCSNCNKIGHLAVVCHSPAAPKPTSGSTLPVPPPASIHWSSATLADVSSGEEAHAQDVHLMAEIARLQALRKQLAAITLKLPDV
jgi:hypothetical protein